MSDHIVLTLNRKNDVIDLLNLAAMLAGIGGQFDDYLKQKHPDVHGHALMGIRELKEGSIIAHLAGVIASDVIGSLDAARIMYDFLKLIRERTGRLASGEFLDGARKKDLENVSNMVVAVAKDKEAEAKFDYKSYDNDGNVREELTVSIDTKGARKIMETAERQKEEMDKTEGADHERVLMFFTRADIGNAKINKSSGEKVTIEEISNKSLSLIYQSELVEKRIKSETREESSVFQKGFVVDANVRTKNGRPVAYAIVRVHGVIELPEG